jgi:hypothetical protein
MTVSVCMIVKNEALHLERCLLSVQGLASEIWVADTGSQDQTQEIARCFTPHVWQIPWNNHFAEARNHSIAQATGDWILILDADEWLTDETRKGLPKFLSQQDHTVPRVFNFLAHTPGEVPLFTRALFPNLTGFAFKGRVHETLRWHGALPEHIHCPQWVIGHEPGDLAVRKRKAAAYLPLIEAELAGDLNPQEQADYYYHAGQSHTLLESPEQALAAYKKAYRAFHQAGLPLQDLFYEQLLRALTPLSLEVKQDLARALGYAKEYVQIHPQQAWARYFKAYCHFLLEQMSLALTELEAFKRCPQTQELTLNAQWLEARCLFLKGDRQTSLQLFAKVCHHLPALGAVHLHWARALFCQEQKQKALAVLSPFLTGPLQATQLKAFLLKHTDWTNAERKQLAKSN